MKKICILLALILCCGAVQAQELDFSNQSCIVETSIPKSECWERINEWIALNIESYKASVDYSSYDTGKVIVKINTIDTKNEMWSVHHGIMVPYIKMTIVFECKDNECQINMKNIVYEFVSGGYVNYDHMSYSSMEICEKEMKYVVARGGKFIADNQFLLKLKSNEDKLDAYRSNMYNDSLSRRERKDAEYSYNQLKNSHNVNKSVATGIAYLLHSILSSIEASIQ